MSENHNIKKTPSVLYEFVVLRLVLIFTLVLYHSMAPYTDAWNAYSGMEDNEVYFWIGRFSYYFMLPAFVFMSGFLFSYTVERKKLKLTFKNTVVTKFNRLIIPSLIFSMVYYLMFFDINVSPYAIGLKIVSGSGHLWFLPMLFWCFVCVYLSDKFKINNKVVLLVAFIIAVLPMPNVPIGITSTTKYFIYFYIGYSMQKGIIRNRVPKNFSTVILICLSLYVVSVLLIGLADKGYSETVKTLMLYSLGIEYEIIVKGIIICSRSLLVIIAGISGIMGLYWIIKKNIENKELSPKMIKLSNYCFGVYIYQQFILIALYYHTDLPVMLNGYVTPWVFMILTLVASLLLTNLLLKTKFGRLLIG